MSAADLDSAQPITGPLASANAPAQMELQGVLTARMEAAQWQQRAGKTAEARQLREQLLRDYTQTGETEIKAEPRAEIRAVCDYLAANYAKSVSLDALAKIVCLSKYHLLRSFTKETGITPYCYLETIRIDRAKDLLKRGNLPAEVAQETGFSDQSHFTNAFKRMIGLTPGQFRRVFAAEEEKEETNGE